MSKKMNLQLEPLVWDADKLGNHRAIIEIDDPESSALRVTIPWRRRDRQPETKQITIISAKSNTRVTNIFRASITREKGVLIFDPLPNENRYYIYYMPYTGTPQAYYPKVEYPTFEETADAAWLAKHGLTNTKNKSAILHQFPEARCIGFESVDQHNAFTEMERIATANETQSLIDKHADQPFLLFVEAASHIIRMKNDLPQRWIKRGPFAPLELSVRRKEFASFQIGLWAYRKALSNVSIKFETDQLPGSFRCFNLSGINWDGSPMQKRINVEQGCVQAIWCGIQIPETLKPGEYSTKINVSAIDCPPQTIELKLHVTEEIAHDSGDSNPARHSRLRWLDSQLGTEDEIVPPFTPIQRDKNILRILGREIKLNDSGLPLQITSFFTPELTKIAEAATGIFSSAPEFKVIGQNKKPLKCQSVQPIEFNAAGQSFIQWSASADNNSINLQCNGRLEFDGCIEYQIQLTANKSVDLKDVILRLPFAQQASQYMTGLGRKSGVTPDEFKWQWNIKKNHDTFWLGAVNAGLQVQLKDENYHRPLNTNFYHLKPLIMPTSWHNHGRGGIRMKRNAENFQVECYSGPRTMQPGETLHYNFRLLTTPFKPIKPGEHFKQRYYHAYKAEATETETDFATMIRDMRHEGGNVINIHHASPINPFINYPFLRPKEMKAYIDAAHKQNCRVKIYYTVRELTTRTPELFALASLGDEVFVDGPGGGHPWLQEHLEANYIAAWHSPYMRDTSVINGVLSRWHNYYIEGLNWLAHEVGIDGIYLDDLGFGRELMLRMRRVLQRQRPNPLIDLHSANQYNERDGFASSLNIYLEHLPYIDRLWFGEYFDYNEPPDYWLTEISGIPFGVMSEMLQDGGNPWRGMVFGMTGRMPRVTLNQALWKFWDAHNLPNCEMIGWWSPNCPVQTNNKNAIATVYRSKEKTIIAIANWTNEPIETTLENNWPALNLNPENASCHAHEISEFQPAREFDLQQPIAIDAAKGWLLILQ